MKNIVYKCLGVECGVVFHGVNRDGVSCPLCKSDIMPIKGLEDAELTGIQSYKHLKHQSNIKSGSDYSQNKKNTYSLVEEVLIDIAQDKMKSADDRISACRMLIDTSVMRMTKGY